MKNLAGDRECDQTIVLELERAMIDIIRVDEPSSEVPSRLRGKLGPIALSRGWAYWIADGPIPLAVALELYEHPIGRRFVRVVGVGVGAAPHGIQVAWYTSDGARVYPTAQEAGYRRALETCAEASTMLGPIVFHDRPTTIGASGYINRYHIDSEDGLQMFVSTLRRHSIDQAARPVWWEQHHRETMGYSHQQLATSPPTMETAERAKTWDGDTEDLALDD